MKKSTLIMALALILSLALGVGGTLAYLTDRDSETNIFTLGNVDIELSEDFQQGAELIPGKEIEKKPVITNTGSTDAYVWYTWAIPAAFDNWNPAGEEGSNENVIHWNPTGATTEGYVTDARVEKAIADGILPAGMTAADILADNMTWDVFNKLVDGGNCYRETINGKEYNVYVLPYNKALEPGETTLPSVYEVDMDVRVDIAPDGEMYFVENGETTKLGWNVDKDGAPVIYVNAYGIQAEGFANVDEAYAAYVGQWGKLNGEYSETVAAPESGAVRPAGYVPTPDEGVIDNLIITDGSDDETNLRALYNGEGGSANYLTEDLTINNSYLDGTYAMNLYAKDGAGVDFVANNTTFAGWTSTNGAFDSVTFNDCTFKVNSEGTYNQIQAHAKTVLNNCELKGTSLTVAGNGTIELVNCTFNGKPLTSQDQLPEGSATVTITVE